MDLYDIQKCTVVIPTNSNLIVKGESFCGADIGMQINLAQAKSLIKALRLAVDLIEPTSASVADPNLN